jgi:crotonobetainyl-CoA:carnitine CoA-transferase CaiB-like acyl-CoA transferase
MGSGHPSLVPYQSFPASDGFFIVGVANQGLWTRFCNAIGRPDLLTDPRFVTNDDRVAHRAECVETLGQVFQTGTVSHWVEVITGAGVPCGPINRVSDVVTDPQVLARGMMADIDHPNVPGLRVPGSPLKLTDTPPSVRLHPPLLGQHNQEVLEQLGYDAKEIARMEETGVVGPLNGVASQ